MKTAIASSNKDKSGDINEKAGRSKYYLIIDESGKVLEVVSNPFSTGGGGAGFGAAKMLADKNVETIVAGQFGPNMIQAMAERGITHLSETGKISDFIDKMTENK